MKHSIFYTLLVIFIYNNITAQQSWNIELLDKWDNDSITNDFLYNGAFNEIWGFVQNNREYSVIGSSFGTHFFEITNDDSLNLIHEVRGSDFGNHIIHRDYHDYNGYLYEVCQEGNSTLRIYDLHFLPDSLPIVYDTNNLITVAHNIFIDSINAKLYSCINSNGLTNSLSIFSLANPSNPTLIQEWEHLSDVHDIYIKNDTAFLNNGSSGGLSILNFFGNTSSGIDPIADILYYDDQGYNHSGWLSDDGNTYIFCDETAGMRFKVCDASDLENIEIIALEKPNTFETTIPHNVIIKNNLAYFSYYYDGLQVYDISIPQSPTRVGYYDTYAGNDDADPTVSFGGAWGVYPLLPSGRILISDRQNGLFLLKNNIVTTLDEQPNNKLDHIIFPNPVLNEVNFNINSDIRKSLKLSIFDSKGQLVKTKTINSHKLKIDIKELKKGTYNYILSSENRKTNGSFIKI